MKEPEVKYLPVRMVSAGGREGEGTDESPAKEVAAGNPLLFVHRLLRGRYLWAIVLGVLGMAGGGAAGYLPATPKYQSAGLIRIRPNMPRVLYQNEQNSVLPMFDAFVESQAAYIRDERVVAAAMESPEWRELRRGASLQDIALFNDSIAVTHPAGSELIRVTFTDTDPKVAPIAVKNLIEAYLALYGERDTLGGAARERALVDRKTAKDAELKSLNERIATICNEVGSTAVERVYDYKLMELQKLETALKRAELAVASADLTAAPTTNPTANLPLKVLARQDHRVAELLFNRDAVAATIERSRSRLGDNHPIIQDLTWQQEVAQKQLDSYVRELKATPQLMSAGGEEPAAVNVDMLKARAENVRSLFENAKKETVELARKLLALQKLRDEASGVRAALDETKQRIEQLSVEAAVAVSGRVDVISRGDRPLAPFKDQRKAMAGAGATAGFGLGVGAVLLFGLANRKLVHVSDADDDVCRGARMLGILPNLPADLSDPEQAAAAAFAVHSIRAMLQLEGGSKARRVYAVTSPTAGDGKTSLALALGISFAASGSRTLLIDCDMIGGGLTAKADRLIRPKLGQVLLRCGIVTEAQLSEGLEMALAVGRRLDEVLVGLGYVTTADVQYALEVQCQSYVGLIDVINGEMVADCVTSAGPSGLFVLPLGSAQPHHASQLSPAIVRRIVDEAKADFDVVIIDTGPVLGSLEASLVAAAVDEVILTVSSGNQRLVARRATEHLSAIRAKIAGVVFNRARRHDVRSSSYSSSASTQIISNRLLAIEAMGGGPELPNRYGPIAHAVASSMIIPDTPVKVSPEMPAEIQEEAED